MCMAMKPSLLLTRLGLRLTASRYIEGAPAAGGAAGTGIDFDWVGLWSTWVYHLYWCRTRQLNFQTEGSNAYILMIAAAWASNSVFSCRT